MQKEGGPLQVNQVRLGAVLSYVSMALSTIISLVYTPIMLERLGDSEFGVYQAVLPIISYLNLLSFGLGSAYVRYYSRFRAAGDREGCAKLNGMFLITYLFLGAVVLAIGFGLSYCDVIFGTKLTAEEIDLAERLLRILSVNAALTFPISVFESHVTINEQYLFQKLVAMGKQVLNPLIMIPLLLMAVVGTIVGLTSGMTSFNFSNVVTEMPFTEGLFGAIVSLAFAFEGWICATSIGSELKDSKKNMPRALLIGTVIVAIVYVIYYVGLAGAVESEVMMAGGEAGAKIAFQNIFGQVGGAAIFVFVVISCWGTCNGLTMAVTRGMFDLAVESGSPKLAMFKNVDANTNMANNSAVFGLLVSSLWLLYFYGGAIMEGFGPFKFDSSELPIITLYAIYIPIYIALIKRQDLSGFRGKVMPVLAILCSLFMVFAAIYSHKMNVVYYLIVFVVIEIIGAFFKGGKKA